MTFPGRFEDSIVPDQLDKIALSFLVDDLEIRRGGTGANIAFSLAKLGHHPLLVASVGKDFDGEYRGWLYDSVSKGGPFFLLAGVNFLIFVFGFRLMRRSA